MPQYKYFEIFVTLSRQAGKRHLVKVVDRIINKFLVYFDVQRNISDLVKRSLVLVK
jgi:hypothetical protein